MYKDQFKKWEIKKNEKRASKGRPALKKQEQCKAIHEDEADLVDTNKSVKQMIEAVEEICEKNLGKHSYWKLQEEYLVVENEWDEAIGSTLHCIQQILKMAEGNQVDGQMPEVRDLHSYIRPMIQEFGFFTLPTLLTLASRMCVKLKPWPNIMQETVAAFLALCRSFVDPPASLRHEPLARFLDQASHICHEDPDSLECLFEFVYSFYIGRVNMSAAGETGTALSLVSLWVIYLKPESHFLEATLAKLQTLIDRCEASRGPQSDETLDLLGLAIYILQMTDKTEQLRIRCKLMIDRARDRLGKPGLEETTRQDLSEKILDTLHVLAKLTAKGGDRTAEEVALDLYREYFNEAEHAGLGKDSMAKIAEMDMEDLRKKLESTGLGK
jgi:hypothetical protein